MKTFREKLDEILTEDDDRTQWEDLVMYAYYAGREQAAKTICDEIEAKRDAQIARADECRYKYMARQIVLGDQTKLQPWERRHAIYSPDYAGDYQAAFGGDPFFE